MGRVGYSSTNNVAWFFLAFAIWTPSQRPPWGQNKVAIVDRLKQE